jgi:hypothetical protein
MSVTTNKFAPIKTTANIPKYWSNRTDTDSALSINTSNVYMNNETYDSCFNSKLVWERGSGSW